MRLTPYAWAKLLALRDLGETEVGAFGVSRPDDLLLIEDVQIVEQVCTSVSVKFDDVSVADYFDEQVNAGRTPAQFARIWIHTHPGDSPHPSWTDEETFARCFGMADWSVMFILARGGQTYARLRYGMGLKAEFQLPVEIDYSCSFPASDSGSWKAEYDKLVFKDQAPVRLSAWSVSDLGRPPWEDDMIWELEESIWEPVEGWLPSLSQEAQQDQDQQLLLMELCDA